LGIAEERACLLAQLKEALLAKQNELALKFAKQLCGINDESNKKED
jgi:hypothetical protein